MGLDQPALPDSRGREGGSAAKERMLRMVYDITGDDMVSKWIVKSKGPKKSDPTPSLPDLCDLPLYGFQDDSFQKNGSLRSSSSAHVNLEHSSPKSTHE